MLALYIIGGVIALPVLFGLITRKQVNIVDTIIINKPIGEVFEYIRHMKNQDHYSVWNRMDPDMKKEYSGTDGQVGFVYKWDSAKQKNVGAGEQEIMKIVPNERVEMELRFKRPMEDTAHATLYTRAKGGSQTEVKWGFYSRMKFPMTIMKPLMVGMLKKSLSGGLADLKKELEK